MTRTSAAIIVLAAAWTLCAGSRADAQLRIVNYNINLSSGESPRAGTDTVLQAINSSAKGGFARPIDVLILEEAQSVTTTGSMFASLMNTVTGGTSYMRSTVDGTSTGSGRPIAVYNSATLQLVSEARIGIVATGTQPRQTMRYQFRPVGYDSSADFYVYASHMKASTGSANEVERNNEAKNNRADADALGQGARVIYTGDLNLYSSSEAAFQTLTGSGNGQAFDPVNRVGAWSGSSSFKDVHTQSPATVSAFGGQVLGGMNDRFDFQLVTGEVLDGRGFDYVTSSYWAFGNTNTHTLNGAVTTGSAATLAAVIPGYTTTQASNVLTALAQITDHLPVVADYQLPAKMSASFAGLPAQAIRGATVSGTLSVANVAPVTVAAGADRLDYSYSASGLLAGTGTGSDMALNSGNAHLLTANTATAGLRTGTVTVSSTSPQAMSATFTGTYSLGILDHAIGSFASGTTTTSLDIDFGTLMQGGTAATRSFDIFNRAGTLGSVWTAKLDLDAITPSGTVNSFSTTLATFANLASGSFRSFTASLATAATGSFTNSYTLTASDENLAGATSQTLTLNLRGVVQAADTIRIVAAGQVQQDSGTITGGGRLIKQGAGELVRSGSSTYTGGTVVQAGLLTVAAESALGSGSLTISASAAVQLQTASLSVSALDVAASGRLNLQTGRVAVAPGGITETKLRADIVAGMGDGSWNGTTGITSGSAAAAGGARAIGYVIDGTGAATVAFAAPGDTNLDGFVDLTDLLEVVGSGKYDAAISAAWDAGDFNYDGIVDLSDLLSMLGGGLYDAPGYLPTSPRLAFAMLDGGSLSAGSPAVASVPEPAGLLIALQATIIISSACLRRR